MTTSASAIDVVERRGRLDAELAEAIGRHERVVRDDAHAEPERATCDLAADPPEPEHAECLPGELDSREARPIPATRRQRGVCLRHVASEREEERDRMLGGRVDGRLGCVRDDDAAAGRGLDVDVVDPDACPPDHLEARGSVDERRVELRRRADHDRVEVADDRREIGLGVLDDVETPSKKLEAGVGDRLANENASLGQTRAASRYASSARAAATPALDRRAALDQERLDRGRAPS